MRERAEMRESRNREARKMREWRNEKRFPTRSYLALENDGGGRIEKREV
ncbi:hypothetical protein VIS19158_05773 [Vibrio scophthalmi LMG 19158]|uniref:Uncharacterized protein n=1 Tax=Vibrio scophthalmi LMG 19158 TaxID=870967 RepID=F9RLP8_9VIBR|nr:hypothetical protein VIS19158_05773 [Vibrio scophthalmi LMG 19158]